MDPLVIATHKGFVFFAFKSMVEDSGLKVQLTNEAVFRSRLTRPLVVDRGAAPAHHRLGKQKMLVHQVHHVESPESDELVERWRGNSYQIFYSNVNL
jgi:hypothetical protein